MGRMGRFDCKGLKDFQQQLGKLQNPDDFVESCAKELAARLLRMVVKRTPVGQYPASSGKKGGTLSVVGLVKNVHQHKGMQTA